MPHETGAQIVDEAGNAFPYGLPVRLLPIAINCIAKCYLQSPACPVSGGFQGVITLDIHPLFRLQELQCAEPQKNVTGPVNSGNALASLDG